MLLGIVVQAELFEGRQRERKLKQPDSGAQISMVFSILATADVHSFLCVCI